MGVLFYVLGGTFYGTFAGAQVESGCLVWIWFGYVKSGCLVCADLCLVLLVFWWGCYGRP